VGKDSVLKNAAVRPEEYQTALAGQLLLGEITASKQDHCKNLQKLQFKNLQIY
jgi:hypothetical protein